MRLNMRIIVSIILVLSVTACSTTKDEELLNYRNSEITPTLEVPPDLTQASSEENLNIPGSKVGLPENTGRYVETGNLNVEVRTLPRIEGISVQGHGDTHWLEVAQKAELVYPQLRRFWAEQGFTLQKDEPAVGVMETEWLTAKSGSDSFIGSMLESLLGAEFKDQYQTRVEREGDSSLVFLAHRGQELSIDENRDRSFSTGRSSGWQMTPADPTKEYEMLSRLMLFLGMQDEQVKQEMEKIGLFSSLARIEFDQENELTYLIISQSFERTWNRLQLQLDRQSITVIESDKDQNGGQMTLRVGDIPGIKASNEEEQDSNIQLGLTYATGANQTRIDVENEAGTELKSEQARQILQWLQQQLK